MGGRDRFFGVGNVRREAEGDEAIRGDPNVVIAKPDYQGGSIVNLMSNVVAALRGKPSGYPAVAFPCLEELFRHRNILLLVLDGLGHDFLCRHGQGSRMYAQLKGRLTSVFPPTTASAITTFLTAQAPQQHGLTGWFMYFRELATVMAVLPGKPRFGGVPLSRCGADPDALFATSPIFNHLPVQGVIVTPRRIAGSDFNLAHCGLAEVRAYETLEEFWAVTGKAVREGRDRKFIYAYWPDLDSLGHRYGIDSAETKTHLAELDEGFGGLCQQLSGSDTFLIITADHGMIDTDPSHTIDLSDHPTLADTLLLPLCGEPRAAYCYVRQGMAERFEGYLREELAGCMRIFRSADLLEQGYFGSGTPHPRLLERIGDYTLIMQDNYVIRDWLPGEKRYRQIGVHGGTSEVELFVPLVTASL